MTEGHKDIWKSIKTIYEDNHLLVVEKPVNIPSQEDESGDPDMLTILKGSIRQRYDKPGNVYLGLVHRLDRPVGGVMVFAKTSKAASRLSEQIRTREFKKTYLAVVNGVIKKKGDRLEHYLVKDSRTNTVHTVDSPDDDAKAAVLDYELLHSNDKFSLVRIQLHTGRPHQIRVQFSAIGHPLYGDQKYGAHVNKQGQQIALWAVSVICRHPTRQEEMVFESNPPDAGPWNLFKI